MYCLFWGLNMGMMETKDLKWIEPDLEEVKRITAKAEEFSKEEIKEPSEKVSAAAEPSPLGKMKNFVRKAVDCCIE